jgi:hypothetical protein
LAPQGDGFARTQCGEVHAGEEGHEPVPPGVPHLSLERAVATGTWTERTAPSGYYHGATYHGTIQLVVDPLGRMMTGKWLGFSKDFKVNSGDWTLSRVENSTAKRTQQRYHFKV